MLAEQNFPSSSDLTELSECPLCDPGWYCDAPGLKQPRAPCDPGYVCYGGAKESGPVDGVTGEVCPAGGYCTLGKEMCILTLSNELVFRILVR
jgi:hypothetical protein